MRAEYGHCDLRGARIGWVQQVESSPQVTVSFPYFPFPADARHTGVPRAAHFVASLESDGTLDPLPKSKSNLACRDLAPALASGQLHPCFFRARSFRARQDG